MATRPRAIWEGSYRVRRSRDGTHGGPLNVYCEINILLYISLYFSYSLPMHEYNYTTWCSKWDNFIQRYFHQDQYLNEKITDDNEKMNTDSTW